jgi:DNA-binding NarL/FixJ family response regulator
VEQCLRLQPDVIVIDISMPDLNGLDATRQIRKACPKTEVLVITHHDSDEIAAEVMDAGARGYVLKSDSDTDLVRAVEALARHKPFFTARVTEKNCERGGHHSRHCRQDVGHAPHQHNAEVGRALGGRTGALRYPQQGSRTVTATTEFTLFTRRLEK